MHLPASSPFTADRKALLTAVVAAVSVAGGIFLLVRYRPTPEYWQDWSFKAHAAGVSCLLMASCLAGWIVTRSLVRAAILGCAGIFLAAGTILWANGALDHSQPIEILFRVTNKKKVYVEQGRNSHWACYLEGLTADGRRFAFTTNSGNLRQADWEVADVDRGDVVVVQQFPGLLNIPWWRISGLRPGRVQCPRSCGVANMAEAIQKPLRQ